MKKIITAVAIAAGLIGGAVAVDAASGNATGKDTVLLAKPCRAADSRIPNRALSGKARSIGLNYGAGGESRCRVPESAVAVKLNVTAVAADREGWIRVTPNGGGDTSTVNYAPTQYAIANSLDVALSNRYDTPAVYIQSSSRVHYVIDVMGWYTGKG